MADSIYFIGDKTVRKQTGNEFTLLRPKRGGDTHKIKSWWHKGRNAVYVDCAVFSVAMDNGSLPHLIIPLQETTRINISHDGAGNFTFGKDFIGVDRVGVADPSTGEVVIEYQMPKISNGSILKRTIGTLPPPANTPVTFTAKGVLTGEAREGAMITGQAATFTGGNNVSEVAVQLQASNDGATGWGGFSSWVVGDLVEQALTSAQLNKYIRVSTRVTDDDGVVTEDSNEIGPVAGPTVQTRIADSDYSYVVDTNNVGTEEVPQIVYTLNGVDGPPVDMSANETVHFDLTAVAGAHPLKIYTDATKTTEVTVGIFEDGDNLFFTPPIAGTFSYQCAQHANMGGDINVTA